MYGTEQECVASKSNLNSCYEQALEASKALSNFINSLGTEGNIGSKDLKDAFGSFVNNSNTVNGDTSDSIISIGNFMDGAYRTILNANGNEPTTTMPATVEERISTLENNVPDVASDGTVGIKQDGSIYAWVDNLQNQVETLLANYVDALKNYKSQATNAESYGWVADGAESVASDTINDNITKVEENCEEIKRIIKENIETYMSNVTEAISSIKNAASGN